jgi:hypothetical protein
MSYRRSKRAALQARAWSDFRQANAVLLQASGVPASLYESRELFDDLLMHGYIDHHEDRTHFFVGQLSQSQMGALVEVAARYLRAGFPDPGIGGLMGARTQEEIRRRADLTT